MSAAHMPLHFGLHATIASLLCAILHWCFVKAGLITREAGRTTRREGFIHAHWHLHRNMVFSNKNEPPVQRSPPSSICMDIFTVPVPAQQQYDSFLSACNLKCRRKQVVLLLNRYRVCENVHTNGRRRGSLLLIVAKTW